MRTSARRRAMLVATVLVAGIALTGCRGNTIDPALGSTPNSVRMFAMGSCDGTNKFSPCEYYFEYRRQGQTNFTKGPTVGPIRTRTDSVRVEHVLRNVPTDVVYEYRICGRGDGVTTFACVGPRGAYAKVGDDGVTRFKFVKVPAGANVTQYINMLNSVANYACGERAGCSPVRHLPANYTL